MAIVMVDDVQYILSLTNQMTPIYHLDRKCKPLNC